MATAPTVITRGPRCSWRSAPSEAAPPECRVTHASAPKRQASAPSRWAQDALYDRQAYVVSALRPSRRKRGHADDVRVAAQHHGVGNDGGDPSPCRDLTGVEPGTAGGNRRERDDRGLRREGLPTRTKRAATLGVDRHGSGQCGDGKGAKEDERGDIAVGDQMHYRPQADANEEWMACNPHDAFGRARHPAFLAHGGRVRRGQSNHRQEKGGKHKYDCYRLPP